jgi:carboxypeptidase T
MNLRNLKTTGLLIVSLFVTLNIFSQNQLSRVKIYLPEDKKQWSEIIGALEIDHFHPENGYMITELTQTAFARLKVSSFKYEVLEVDVAKKLKELNDTYYASRGQGNTSIGPNKIAFEQSCKTLDNIISVPSVFEVKSTYGGYYSYAEMTSAIDALVTAYPTLAQKFSIGTTAGGRTIWGVKISDNVTTDESGEPEVLYMGLQHAREAIGGSSMIFLMQYLCEFYASNTAVKNLVDNREFFIFPCFNPDGWEYNRTNGGAGSGWRKNRRLISGSTYGVDLNRNWSIDWANCGAPIQGAAASCGSATPSSDTYYGGPAAFSEAETQAMRTFVQGRNIIAAIDQHAYGPYYSLPFGRPSLHTFTTTAGVNTADSIFYNKTAALMGKYNGMRAANSYQALGYEVAGGFKDWMLMGDIGTGTKIKAYGLTGEGGAGGGTGGTYGSFWAPASEIINLCQGMTYQNIQLALVAGSYAEIEDANDIILSATSGNLNFDLRRVGLQSGTVNVSVIPIENVQTVGSAVNVTTLTSFNSTYSGSISYTLPAAIPTGQRVRFAWRVESGGNIYYDTVTKFYNPVQLFYDDMEGSSVTTNWTVTGGWNYTTTAAYQGSKSLSESPSGNYTTSSTRIATYKNTFNISDATATYLSFWTRHRAENFRDKLQIEVSTNGTTWVPVCGTTTVQEPGTLDGSTINGQPSLTGIEEYWTRNLVDLSTYNGASSLQLRFEFASDADGSGFDFELDDGFNLDNVKVIKTTTAIYNLLSAGFNTVYASLTDANAVLVDWETFVNANHDYFVVEHATDGRNYTALGTVKNNPPYKFIHNTPAAGNNYYRIKQVLKDGKYNYSKVVTVVYNPGKVNLVLYPNPVADKLGIKISNTKTETIGITITDTYGRVIKEEKALVNAGNNEIKLNVSNLAAQAYMIKIINQNKELITTQKFIKQ